MIGRWIGRGDSVVFQSNRGGQLDLWRVDVRTDALTQLTSGEAFPRVLVARRVERDEHFYAGPFMPASLARKAMSLSHKLFGIRSCNETITGDRPRPCLE